MTKKDFELIASCFFENNFNNDINTPEYLSMVMAHKLASRNPRFDKEKFLQACGIDKEKNCIDCGNKIDNTKNCISCNDIRCHICCHNR